MQQRARVQHNPIKSATTVLSEEQRPEREKRKEVQRASKGEMEKEMERERESRLNSQIKEEWVRDVFIHQKLQTPTHGFSSGLSVPRRSLMNWWAEGGVRRRRAKSPIHPPTPTAATITIWREHPSMPCHRHTTQKDTKKLISQQKNFKFHVIVPHSPVGEQRLACALQITKNNHCRIHSSCRNTEGGMI